MLPWSVTFQRFQLLILSWPWSPVTQIFFFLQIVLNPIGERIVDMFFPDEDNERLYFRYVYKKIIAREKCNIIFLVSREFARKFAVFRPVKSSTPSYAVNSRESKVKLPWRNNFKHCIRNNGFFSFLPFPKIKRSLMESQSEWPFLGFCALSVSAYEGQFSLLYKMKIYFFMPVGNHM